MTLDLPAACELSEDDRHKLGRVAAHLNLLADLSHADLFLLCPADGEAVVVAEARPEPVPSLYTESQIGSQLRAANAPGVWKVLFGGRSHHHFGGVMVRGVPTMQEVFAIRGNQGGIIAALCSEMPMLEHERLRKRAALFRRAIARVRELVIAGRLEGGDKLDRLEVHDGVMVIDGRGRIQYISAVAEQLYRRLGYADTLINTQLAELDTNEYVCFRAMELGVCIQQRLKEQDSVWIKRAVPLLTTEDRGLLSRLGGSARLANGAVIVITDVTDEVRKEQELKVKTAMIQEIHHRVKNNLQTIAALLRLQARKTSSDEVAEQLRQTINRILSIAVVHEFLSKDEQAVINIHEVCNRIVNEVTHGTLDPEKKIEILLEGSKQFCLPAQQATSCALIINELLQNAVEHGYRDRLHGTIHIRLDETGDSMTLEIRDDGAGLPPGFTLEEPGLGLRIVKTLVQVDLKGQFALTSDGGVRALVSFPRWRENGPVGSLRQASAASR